MLDLLSIETESCERYVGNFADTRRCRRRASEVGGDLAVPGHAPELLVDLRQQSHLFAQAGNDHCQTVVKPDGELENDPFHPGELKLALFQRRKQYRFGFVEDLSPL